MANYKTKDADAGDIYLKAAGAGTDLDPAIIEKSDAGVGATGDAAASAGGTGSLSAKLRLVTTQLNTQAGYLDGIETLLAALEALLTTIDADTSTLAGAVSGSEVQADIVSSALPAGAATEAKQDTAITALQLIDNIVPTINGPGAPTIDSYAHIAINLGAAANQVLVSSAADKQIWVYGFGFTLQVAGSVSFQDEDDTALSGIMTFAANSGMAVPVSGNFAMPLWKVATDKDLEVDVVTAELDGWLCYAIVSV